MKICRNCGRSRWPFPHRCYYENDVATLTVSLPPEAMVKLKRIAELAGVSVEEAVIRLLNSYMEKL